MLPKDRTALLIAVCDSNSQICAIDCKASDRVAHILFRVTTDPIDSCSHISAMVHYQHIMIITPIGTEGGRQPKVNVKKT